jgi:hypothetical protein
MRGSKANFKCWIWMIYLPVFAYNEILDAVINILASNTQKQA